MPRKKKIVEETTEVTPEETPKVAPEVAVDSEAKKEFRAFIELYKAQRPEKYKSKEQELLKKLESL